MWEQARKVSCFNAVVLRLVKEKAFRRNGDSDGDGGGCVTQTGSIVRETREVSCLTVVLRLVKEFFFPGNGDCDGGDGVCGTQTTKGSNLSCSRLRFGT